MHFDCGRSRKTRNLIQKSCQETPYRDLRSCQNTSYGDLVRRHCVEICCKNLFPGLLYRSCPEGFCTERKHGDLIKRSCQEISCPEVLPRDLLWNLYSNLAKRSTTEILQQSSYRDLVQRSCQETSHGDLVKRPGEES